MVRKRLSCITTKAITGFTKHWLEQGVSIATANHALATLRLALRLAVEWREIDHAPRVHMLAGEVRREAVLPATRQAAYLIALKPELAPVAAPMLETGLRPSAALSLRWADVALPKDVRASIACAPRWPNRRWLATFRWVAPAGRLWAGSDWRQGRPALLVASPSCLHGSARYR